MMTYRSERARMEAKAREQEPQTTMTVLRDLLNLYERTGDHVHEDRSPTEGDGDCVACTARRILRMAGSEAPVRTVEAFGAPLCIANDADDDGTPHWKYRVRPSDIWSADSFPTRMGAEIARIMAKHGFELEQTGGGCMAYIRRINPTTELLITDSNTWVVGVDPKDEVWGWGIYDELDQHNEPRVYAHEDGSLSTALRHLADAVENTPLSVYEGTIRAASTEVWLHSGEAAAEGEV